MKKIKSLLLLLALCSTMLYAQEPQLLMDMNPTGSSYIRDVVEVNGKTFLLIDNIAQPFYFNKLQLWVTDGTNAGTLKLLDNFMIDFHGSFYAEHNYLHVMNGLVYFSYKAGFGSSSFLYKTDGTIAGTMQVPGSPNNFTSISEMKVFDNCLYFSAADAANSSELWKYDGTSTFLFKEFIPGAITGVQRSFTIYNNKLFFVAWTLAHYAEIWSTDGTLAGTSLLLDINTTPIQSQTFSNAASDPQNLTVALGKLFFSANDGIHEYELWVTDGTAVGTHLVKDINITPMSNTQPGKSNSNPNNLYEANGSLFFSAYDIVLGSAISQIYVSDGTSAGTIKLSNASIPLQSNGNKFIGPAYNGFLYYAADDLVNGNELWFTNGTAVNTAMYQNMNVTSGAGSNPVYREEFNNKLYFTATTINGSASGLYETDGNPAFTQLVQPLGTTLTNHNPGKLFVTSDRIYYSAQYQSGVGSEPYYIVGESAKLWTGNTSTDWFTASNWEPQQIPTTTDKVLIDAGKPNYPVITSGDAECGEFTIKPNATITMTGGTLSIFGNFDCDNAFSTYFSGGTVNMFGGGNFVNGITFSNLTLSCIDISDPLLNIYMLYGDMFVKDLTLSGIIPDPSLPGILTTSGSRLRIEGDLKLNQGYIGDGGITDVNNPAKVEITGGTAGNMNELTFNNVIDMDFPLFTGISADLVINNDYVKLINTNKNLQVNNLHLSGNFNLRGMSLSTLGKIIYPGATTYKLKNSGGAANVGVEIINDINFSPDDQPARLNCSNIGAFISYKMRQTGIRANDTLILLDNTITEEFYGDGCYLDLNGKNFTIGNETTGGFIDSCEIGTNIKSGTLKFQGQNTGGGSYRLFSKNLNNLTINTTNGVNFMNDVYDAGNFCNVYGTIRLLDGLIDLNGTNITLARDEINNTPNVAKLVETPFNIFIGETSFIEIDTTYTTPLTNANIGGLGLILTTTTGSLNNITIGRFSSTQGVANATLRSYFVANAPSGSLGATVKIKYDELELNGIPESDLRIFRSNSNAPGGWEMLPSVVNVTNNVVRTTGFLSSLTPSNSTTAFYILNSINNPPARLADPISHTSASSVNTLQLKAYPNPFTNSFNIAFDATASEEAQLMVTDISGRVFHNAQVEITEGENKLNVCCLDKAPSGVYFVNLKTSTGNNMVRLIKNN